MVNSKSKGETERTM